MKEQTYHIYLDIYTVHQTSGWDGRELMKDFDVFISADGQTYRFLINNANFESYIKIVKKDAETGNTIPYAGAGFQIYDPNGNLVTMTFTYPEVTTIDTFYTTEDGYLITPQTLEYGTGYSLVEVQAPYGYVLNSEPVYFDVAQDNSTEESGITVIEVVRSNMAQKGTITVSKSGEVFSSVFENNGLYQPIFAVSGLEGAVYEITAAEDIYTLDGTLRASKGEVVDTISSSAYTKTIWQCVTATKQGKKYCPHCKGIPEEVIEKAFVKSYQLLCSDQQQVVEEFLQKVEGVLNEDTSLKRLPKIEKEMNDLRKRKEKLLDLRLDTTIDRDIYESKNRELSEQLKKLQE